MQTAERKVYGATGEVGKDGLLTPDQYLNLNRIQEKAANACMRYLNKMGEGEAFPMVAMATGIGKGSIIHRVVEKQIRRKSDSNILIIAGTKIVLTRQTHEALAEYQENKTDGFHYTESEDEEEITYRAVSAEENPLADQYSILYKTGKLGQKKVNVHVATIQTVQSEIKKGTLNADDYDLLIVDEVHNIGTQPRKTAIQNFKKVVGFTATPFRHSGRLKLPEQYGFKIIESLSLPEAQNLRLLPPLLGIQIDTKDVVDEIPTTMTGRIDFKALEKLLKNSPELRPYVADRVASIITHEGRNYKTVIAVNFVWEAQELAELLQTKGIRVGVAINKQAAKQIHTEEIPALDSIERYKLPENDQRSIQVLISPYVASEGFDAPFTEVLIWASPTDSSLRYTQYTGRLARRAEGKLFGVVIDCLYQTSQYSWSYNMGMWMKDNVVQFDSGLLWLGPETDIANLKQLPQIERLRQQADIKTLDALQRQKLLPVQDTDFSITQETLTPLFVGDQKNIRAIVDKVLTSLKQEDESFVAQRISHSHIVNVITDKMDKNRFIQEMVENGAELKKPDLLPIQDSDFPITTSSVKSTFEGGIDRVYAAAGEILAEIKETEPELIALRTSGKRTAEVITDRQKVIDAMIERGFSLRACLKS